MLFMPAVWSWQWTLVLHIFLSFLVPLFSNPRVRYYACYMCYCLNVSLIGLLLIPVFLARPRRIENFTLYGKCCKLLTKLIGVEWTVRNEHRLAEQRGSVIVANHQSILDILGMFNIWEMLVLGVAIAKMELLYAPFFGLACWLGGTVFINRKKSKEALEIIRKASHMARELKLKLWLFPEGTRNQTGEQNIQPFKMGAFLGAIEAHLPIIPVVFSPYYFIDNSRKTFHRGEVIVSVLEEVPTEGLTRKDAGELMNKVHNLMSAEYERLKREVEMRYGTRNR